MPSVLHEAVISSVVGDIKEQLRSRATGLGAVAKFIQNIKHTGSASIKSDDPDFGRHDPDASFKHLEAQYLGVVIEVSFTEEEGFGTSS
jgi:hypothetical protein